jgi:hypothetical protein
LSGADVAEVVGRHGIVGVHLQRLLQLFYRRFEASLSRPCIAKIISRISVIGIQLYSLLKLINRFF